MYHGTELLVWKEVEKHRSAPCIDCRGNLETPKTSSKVQRDSPAPLSPHPALYMVPSGASQPLSKRVTLYHDTSIHRLENRATPRQKMKPPVRRAAAVGRSRDFRSFSDIPFVSRSLA